MTNRCSGSAIGSDYHGTDGAPDHLCPDCRKTMQEGDARQEQVWELFCGEDDGHFEHFFPSVMQVEMCGNVEIFRVRLTPDDNGEYYGWYYSHHPDNGSKGTISMIYRREFLVEMCFAYGTTAEKQRGRGKMMRFSVEKLRRAKKGEGIK